MATSTPTGLPTRKDSTMSKQQNIPPSLLIRDSDPEYGPLKQKFQDQRKKAKDDPNFVNDLKAYESSEDTGHEYSVLKGLIPPALVGKEEAGVPGHIWKRSETFFTDYASRHKDLVISKTSHSLIIANTASHDVRQYMADYDPETKDKMPSAGMSYFHFLVIPIQKVYNAVSVDDTKVIQEMISHFKKFWNGGRSAPRFIERINEAVDRRAKAVFDGYKSNPDTVAKRTEEFEKVMATVREDADAFAKQLADVKDNQFFFGFHAHPDASVGHLHMHVLLGQSKFRTYSTGVHDWKTIPAQAVITVIRREKPRRFQDLVLHLIHSKGKKIQGAHA